MPFLSGMQWKQIFNAKKCGLFTFSIKRFCDYSVLEDKTDRAWCLMRAKLGLKKPPFYLLRKSSVFLYESCTDGVEMVACRCMAIESTGLVIRNQLFERMWEDTSNRLDKLHYIKRRQKFSFMQDFNSQFAATLFGLDEGILSSDIVLAGALWRNLLGISEEAVDPVVLDFMIQYSRLQLNHLFSDISDSQILLNDIKSSDK
ncbi:ubiquinol-cytochrome c reductase complex chaperone CBP3-like protein [Sarcoptes scabiei]|uniref:Ubiquinol-cytochrome c reductase complex chaperone CBP3-like protein n=1 Tax=Sarcoptes scabiei TaxID=52283 RepID=A0A132A0U5_SARSC|nr:ubiquinol-cytochrome c reductase complex chaperone CBP3-like protein [Sarcoptes scabiei]